MFRRSSGVLLHISSLPGPYGIGDIGPAARKWVDWLAGAGCRYWQILPLGPSGFGNSPYSSRSSFAGNIDLVSPDLLHAEGLIDRPEPHGEALRVDYPVVRAARQRMVREGHARQTPRIRDEFADFREREAGWLEPYSLYMALNEAHGGASWTSWDEDLRNRESAALATASRELSRETDLHAFGQFTFYRQLGELRGYAAEKGVEIIGDVPLYVANDSVDVWGRPELFAIDPVDGEPRLIAGVPPDHFSPIGQVWGTPTYRWDIHAQEGYSWWVDRLAAFLRHADVLRIDHFTGFARYYTIDRDNTDPLSGEWLDGPGIAFFDAVRARLGDIPLIVEDPGPLGEEVERLRTALGYPGIRVLQQAFEPDPGPMNQPDHYPENLVVYTGTHDTDTAVGRLGSGDEGWRRRALSYTGGTAETFAPDLVSKAWESNPMIAITPLQDLMGLGAGHRMNTPGTVDGNWEWRVPEQGPEDGLGTWLADLNRRTGRSV
jgi:4-alpha-glucanotransferase